MKDTHINQEKELQSMTDSMDGHADDVGQTAFAYETQSKSKYTTENKHKIIGQSKYTVIY